MDGPCEKASGDSCNEARHSMKRSRGLIARQLGQTALLKVGLLAASTPTSAQEVGMLVLEAPASIESAAYGNTPYFFSDEAGLLFYSPALIEQSTGVATGFQRYGTEGTLTTLSGAGTGLGGGFAAGFQYMSYDTPLSFLKERDLQSFTFTQGEHGVTEFAGSIGYARTVLGVHTGVALKYLQQIVDSNQDQTWAADFGLAKEVGRTMISLTAKNLGSDLKIVEHLCAACDPTELLVTHDLELPTQIVAGVSVEQFEVGEFDMILTSQIMRRRDGEFIPAGGVEVSYWPVQGYTFRIRTGLQRVTEEDRSPFTVGAAFTGDNITIEYAFQSFDERGSAHRFGLRWH